MKKRWSLTGKFVQLHSNLLEFLASIILYRRKKGLTTENGVLYGDTKKSVCDFYYNERQGEEGGKKRPVLIYIHGGGWVSGIRRLRRYYCYEYADRGFFVMNTGYDLAPQKAFPHQLRQLFKAFDFLCENAEKYNLDTERVVLAGESAGAYYISYLSCIMNSDYLQNKLGIEFKNREKFNVRSVLLLNGAYDIRNLAVLKTVNIKTFIRSYTGLDPKEVLEKKDTEEVALLSPIDFIDSSFPPAMVVQGASDVYGSESRNIIKIFSERGVDFDTVTAEGIAGVHGFCLAVKLKEGKKCFEAAYSFAQNRLEQQE